MYVCLDLSLSYIIIGTTAALLLLQPPSVALFRRVLRLLVCGCVRVFGLGFFCSPAEVSSYHISYYQIITVSSKVDHLPATR